MDHASGEASRRPKKKLSEPYLLSIAYGMVSHPSFLPSSPPSLFRFHNYYYDYYRLLKDVPHHELQLPVEVVDAHSVLETTFCKFTRMILPAFKLVLQRCWLLP